MTEPNKASLDAAIDRLMEAVKAYCQKFCLAGKSDEIGQMKSDTKEINHV